MARIRTIKPEFPLSETVGKLSREARLLFILLWTVCDDQGRARAASRMLASLLYPYDDDAQDLIDGWLDELERADCIRRYAVKDTQYLEVVTWLKHQKIDKPSESRLPPFAEGSRTLSNIREASAPDLGPRTLDQERTKKEETREDALLPTDDWPPNFREVFWIKYPNKVGKPDALKKLDRVRKTGGVPWAELWGGLERYVAKTDDRPWCNPATWIHQQRWADQPANGAKNAQTNQHHPGGAYGASKDRFRTAYEKLSEFADSPDDEGDRPGGTGVVEVLPPARRDGS